MTDKVVTISWETGYSLISRETAERESDQSPALPAKLVRQPPVRIDTLMTKEQFRKLVRHMLNDNPVSHFLQGLARRRKGGSCSIRNGRAAQERGHACQLGMGHDHGQGQGQNGPGALS